MEFKISILIYKEDFMFGIGVPELALLFFFIAPFCIAIWIGLDAKKRYDNGLIGAAWFVGSVFFPIIAWIGYLIARPSQK